VNLAAIAERAARTTRELSSFVYLWLGEGLGLGVDIDGEVQRGAFGGAGEVGYVEVPRSAAAIDPDAVDFTDLLGGPAVRRIVGAAPDSRLRDALDGLDANDGALAALADRVALLASPVLAVLDPSAIVIGGPTGLAAGDRLAALVQERITDEPAPKAKPSQVRSHHKVSVHRTLAGASPVLRGARRMLVAEIRDRLEAAIVVDAPSIG
jgi:predicted NBD/HSP70 family sugar kinase